MIAALLQIVAANTIDMYVILHVSCFPTIPNMIHVRRDTSRLSHL